MFDNIGGKIKGLAKVMFWIEAIAFVVLGLACFGETLDNGNLYGVIGCMFMLGGPIFALISSLFIYGFGILVERAERY